jgi:hypothetical protein
MLMATMTVFADYPQGGQADGVIGRRRPSVTTTQVFLLPQRHGEDVPLSLTGTHHSVPGTLAFFMLMVLKNILLWCVSPVDCYISHHSVLVITPYLGVRITTYQLAKCE